MNGGCIAANIARLRLDRQLTQGQLAERAGISRMAVGKIERGGVVPRSSTLVDLAAALAVPVGELVTPVRPLQSVRFRAKAQVHGREQILAVVSKWLEAFCWLEAELEDRPGFGLQVAWARGRTPAEVAQDVRAAVGLQAAEPVRNISRLLEDNGVKLLLLETTRDSFFGLSVGEGDGGAGGGGQHVGTDFGGALDLHCGPRARASAAAPWGVPAGGDRDGGRAGAGGGRIRERVPDAGGGVRRRVGADAWAPAAGSGAQGEADLPRELYDRAPQAGGDGSRDIGGLGRLPASA